MKYKILIIILVCAAIAAVAYWQMNNSLQSLSNEEIYKKFDCDRGTDDYRVTDYYCHYPERYRAGEPIPKNLPD